MNGYSRIVGSMLTKERAWVKHTTRQRRSTLHNVGAVIRGLGRSIVRAAVAAAVVAAGRALLGRLARDQGEPRSPRGSFDTWPAVPSAPGRREPNGSGVPAGS
jgi:hypothetical protein